MRCASCNAAISLATREMCRICAGWICCECWEADRVCRKHEDEPAEKRVTRAPIRH
jgi:hypothetical protein